jgi:Right handed beta helix region
MTWWIFLPPPGDVLIGALATVDGGNHCGPESIKRAELGVLIDPAGRGHGRTILEVDISQRIVAESTRVSTGRGSARRRPHSGCGRDADQDAAGAVAAHGVPTTVTNNRAFDNGDDGIAVGQKSLVTHNTANRNGGDGIEAVCPSTVTYNQTAGNGDLDRNLIGAGCFSTGNTNDPE